MELVRASRNTACWPWILALAGVLGARAANLSLRLAAGFGPEPLAFDAWLPANAQAQTVSVTRLDLLLSGIALRRPDGTWIGNTNWFAFANARDGVVPLDLKGLPEGTYDALRFQIGPDPETNHRDPAAWPAGHPLNPLVNGLHWGWQGGYVFAAIEGHWIDGLGGTNGYSFHVATDAHRTTVELPAHVRLPSVGALGLRLDVAALFARPNPIRLVPGQATTHSRTNDPLARRLRENLEAAFSVVAARDGAGSMPTAGTNAVVPLVAPGAKPYRLVIPANFPRPALPRENPLTEEGVALGRALFHDTRLSRGNVQSCATCHDPARGFADGEATSKGADGIRGTRNAMALSNLAWKDRFFWDGRAATLREQVLQPIVNPAEMDEALPSVVAKLGTSAKDGGPDYPRAFAAAFGSTLVDADRLARALEQYLLVQIAGDSRFDRVQRGQESFTEEERRGFELFHTENDPAHGLRGADCFHCHGGALFRSQGFGNTGLEPRGGDIGRGAATGRAGDRLKFAVPSLRDVATTGPYMHDGRFATLAEVVAHYDHGVRDTANLDPNLAKHAGAGLGLDAADRRALVAFLLCLTENHKSTTP